MKNNLIPHKKCSQPLWHFQVFLSLIPSPAAWPFCYTLQCVSTTYIIDILYSYMSSLPLWLYLRLYDSRQSDLAYSAIKLVFLYTAISRNWKLLTPLWLDPKTLLRQALWTNWRNCALLWNAQCWGCLF